MKAEDLRIGNWLMYEKTTHQVTGISGKSIKSIWRGNQRIDECDDFIFSYEPILITEKWLLASGFLKDEDGVIKIDKCLYWLDNGLLQVALSYAPIMNCPCKYVHQLQNLYYAFTGAELAVAHLSNVF